MSKSAKEHEMAMPTWIAKLKEAGMSSTEIGMAIGKSGAYANQCLIANQASKTAEIAAEFVWTKKFGSKNKADKVKVCLVTIEEQYVQTVQTMVEAFRGNMSVCAINK